MKMVASAGKGTFGLVPSRGGSGLGGRGQQGNGPRRFNRRAAGGNNFKGSVVPQPDLDENGAEVISAAEERFKEVRARDAIDEKMGFFRFDAGPPKSGWMVNMHPTLVRDEEWPTGRAACDYYFLEDNGSTFKSTAVYSPYFYVMCKDGFHADVEEHFRRKYESLIESIAWVEKEDLDMPNHLLGIKRVLLKLGFRNVQDLLKVRKDVIAAVRKQKVADQDAEIYQPSMNVQTGMPQVKPDFCSRNQDPASLIVDIREYDVPYYLRVAMDNDYRVGVWYNIIAENGKIEISTDKEKVLPADPVVLAFDIETTKMPLKFPDASHDQVMMISYMLDGQGYLITNREIVSEDILDFEYTPKPEFEGPFVIFNEANECDLLRRFFDHIIEVKPQVFVTYNGDFFDWPFVEARAKIHSMDMHDEIGVFKDENDEYKAYYAHHSDCIRWVKRDSYLPAGSHGLKAVTTSKLGYNPIELDPEVMVQFAQEQPQVLAQYSVSDAVATYYLYMKYVHPFIFSLCNIIPMNPDEVLRKGSGTLCESLLMVQAYKADVIMPNKHVDEVGKFFEGHLLTSETYTGGHVEALEAGVFRSDIPAKFKIGPEMVTKLIDDVERALRFTIKVEHGTNVDDVINFDEVKHQIISALQELRETPNRLECPLIYHLDVAAMYPNIILTNRLQPDAMVSEAACASCDFNSPENKCKRLLEWKWRGEFYPATRGEYNMLYHQIKSEPEYLQMNPTQRQQAFTKRLSEYSRKIYKKIYEKKEILKTSTVCQRENPFYINTVRQFRDRRYEYKGLLKVWKKKLDEATNAGDTAGINEGKKMVVVMDSLQLAHKCILNSFYGYVMRKGSRWFSMEMGGIVCYTGSKIIQLARELIEQVGRPLELDTDGIWCILPKSFPENFVCKTAKGKKIVISYPCTMLNHLVHDTFTNHQYQSRESSPDGKESLTDFVINSENSIFFEVDGPYKAMILPASTEEDKLLKKRYAVFNEDGSLAELKGFEVKRRGELKLIKIFQQQIFAVFLKGSTLEECYKAVADVANEWLDILDSQGASMTDSEVIDLIGENKSMSKSLSEYGSQKSTPITTAKRLAEFLGNDVVRDKLSCHFIIARKPVGSPVAERAVPVAILHTEPAIRKHFLRKWLKDASIGDPDIRQIIDWDYYKERFGSVLQKLITIPAAMQKVTNPIPRVKHPDWLRNRVTAERQQSKLTELFDMEDMKQAAARVQALPPVQSARVARVTKVNRRKTISDTLEEIKSYLLKNICPKPQVEYRGWLAYQRQKWKYQHLAKKHKDRLTATNNNQSQQQQSGATSQMDSFLRLQQSQLEANKWHVVQVKEAGSSFILWVLSSGKLHQIILRIPRIFYVNSHLPISPNQASALEGIEMKEAKKMLPRGTPAEHLYQCTVDEDVYQLNEHQFTQFFSHPSIQGVYETQIPGVFRAITHLGCTSTLSRKKAGLTRNIDWNDLQIANGSDYLVETSLSDTLLYHSSNGERHWLVLLPFREGNEGHIFMADPSGKVHLGSAESLYSAVMAKYPHLPSVSFQVTSYRGESQMLSSLNKVLASMHRERMVPQILYVQSNKPNALATVKSLEYFPNVIRSASIRDSDYPALDWQRYAFKRWSEQAASFNRWKESLLDYARYACVPLGNMGTDPSLMAMDVMLARRLAKADHVLWYSHEARPDLGGRQDDEHYSVLDVHMTFPEVNAPGMYHCVSVDMDLIGLCVASLLDMMHTELQPFIQLIKDLTGSARDQNIVANDLLMHVYRWITCSKALLYDPHATFTIFNHMKRVFMALVSELKKLNTTVVFASFNRLVVETPKNRCAQASAFVQFLISHIETLPQFSVLKMAPVRMWSQLAWMDTFNHGGFQYAHLGDEAPESSQADEIPLPDATQVARPELLMQWNIAEFLPEVMVSPMMDLLGHYYTEHSNYRANSTRKEAVLGISDDEIKFKQNLIRSKYKRRLFQLVPRFNRLEHGADGLQFPRHPGSYRKLVSPTLEFIKYVTTILGLDKDIEDEVRVMRRNALDLIQVREFAPAAEFANPCLPLVVYQAVCAHCGSTNDLDLTRDRTLRERWACHECGYLYARTAIEVRLVEMVENSLLSHQVQDLRCTKCRLIKRENLHAYCTCSGTYALTHATEPILDKLRVLRGMAQQHHMELLSEIVDFTLGVLVS